MIAHFQRDMYCKRNVCHNGFMDQNRKSDKDLAD